MAFNILLSFELPLDAEFIQGHKFNWPLQNRQPIRLNTCHSTISPLFRGFKVKGNTLYLKRTEGRTTIIICWVYDVISTVSIVEHNTF